jgi:beta-glucosidase
VEGAAHLDGRTDSIWDAFCRRPGAIKDTTSPETACDHYHRYADDVALMKAMNLDSYRFSTSWTRVMPDARTVNPAGLDFYSRLVDSLLEAGILPWLTLYHWDLPQVLEEAGGWPVRDTAYRFVEYAMAVHEALSDRVRCWTTINEPWCSAYLSYIAGEHAPGRHNRAAGIAAGHHLLLAHGLAAEAIKAADPEANVGLALNLWPFDAADLENPGDVAAAVKQDGTWNRAFMDPVLRGAYPEDVAGWYGEDLARVVLPGDLEIISTPIDSLGVNFYNGSVMKATAVVSTVAPFGVPAKYSKRSEETLWGEDDGAGSTTLASEADSDSSPTPSVEPDSEAVRVETTGITTPAPSTDYTLADDGLPDGLRNGTHWVQGPNPAPEGVDYGDSGLPVTDMGWAIQPEGLTRLLRRLQEDYTGPRGIALWITENGAAYTDEVGPNNYVNDQNRLDYIDKHLRAVQDALDSGVDIRGYQVWCLMDNFEWALGYTTRFGVVHCDFETQQRTPKASGMWYAEVARTKTIPPRSA